MKFRVLHVTDRKQVKVPRGWSIHHTNCSQVGKKKPFFSILMVYDKDPEPGGSGQRAIGFCPPGDDEED